jgi:hypothetical protein
MDEIDDEQADNFNEIFDLGYSTGVFLANTC